MKKNIILLSFLVFQLETMNACIKRSTCDKKKEKKHTQNWPKKLLKISAIAGLIVCGKKLISNTPSASAQLINNNSSEILAIENVYQNNNYSFIDKTENNTSIHDYATYANWTIPEEKIISNCTEKDNIKKNNFYQEIATKFSLATFLFSIYKICEKKYKKKAKELDDSLEELQKLIE